MGLFDVFKKKEESAYDPSNIKVTDLQKGFFLDYDMKTWVVKEMYEYDWGNNFFSFEYKLDSGDDTVFLYVEDDDELYLSVTKGIKIRAIDEDLPEYIIEHEFPPKKLEYNKLVYFKDKESTGFFREIDTDPDESAEFVSWEFYDESGKNLLVITQWDDREFDAAVGTVTKEFEISNIVPGKVI